MNLQQILNVKGSVVFTTDPKATLAAVVEKLVEHNCGSLVVCDNEEMVGIISERDILRAFASGTGSLDQLHTEQFMTSKVHTGELDDSVETIMGLMTEKRIRHLPVIKNGKLSGIISIGDVVKAQHDHLTMENHYLKNYIQS